jgi:DNA-binding IclR family transcriptional regulator
VIRALGYEPPRATLFRVLNQLVSEGWLSIAEYSLGRSSTRYSKRSKLPGSR